MSPCIKIIRDCQSMNSVDMASPDDLLAMLEEAAEEAESAQQQEEKTDEYEDVLESLMEDLVDVVTLGVAFEVHRSCKMGIFMLDNTDVSTPDKKFEIIHEPGYDVFGHIPMKRQYECGCPNCQRTIAASRFAPHLEKCMGMGRNSSRIASRRIANVGKKESDNDTDDDNDSDWNFPIDKKVKKLRKEKSNSPRRNKNSKQKNGDIPQNGSLIAGTQYEDMTLEERKIMLLQACGVISESTKKVCMKTGRCPQHTDQQRKAIRAYILGHQSRTALDEDIIDIDSYEDGDAQALRDSLQWEAVSNPSPSDSTSTINSTSGRSQSGSRKKKSKAKKKGVKRPGSAGTPSTMYDFT